jgi:hypothetical protein
LGLSDARKFLKIRKSSSLAKPNFLIPKVKK